MGATAEDRVLVELGRRECLDLLLLESIGRLAMSTGDGPPDVFPVNYAVHQDQPVFRTHRGLILKRSLTGQVTFQADQVDWAHRIGWTVMVQGRAELVDRATLGDDIPDTWLPGDQFYFVRLVPQHVSGRRIELHQAALDGRGYL